MLYHLLYPLKDHSTIFNVFRYITFRTAYATLTALIICLIIGPWLIRRLREFQIGQSIREEGPAAHKTKAGTPTMGGLLILIAVVIPTLLWADLKNRYVWMTVGSMVAFGLVGFLDDYRKLVKKTSLGITGKTKMGIQILIGAGLGVVLFVLAFNGEFSTKLAFPFIKSFSPDLSWVYILFVIGVLVSTSNAVNLTDGLDGLAIGTTLIVSATYTILTYVAGNAFVASYLSVPYVSGVGEVTIFCGAMVGASLGFLWFNAYPAQVFMGDVGSLAIGGAIGTVAVLIKQEVLLVIAGGLFVMEAVSVILQVIAFQGWGKRIFLMSPLHHHFELKGWKEPKIVIRFWILSILFALLCLSTLKLR
jgi:phospho-N-acetylmuramoyl-pentapeptide-transferase